MLSIWGLLFLCLTGSSIRLKGRNLTESEHIKLGAYHTLELEPQRAFTLHKRLWDSLDVERIKTACDPQASADLAVLLITVRAPHETGGSYTTSVAADLQFMVIHSPGLSNCRVCTVQLTAAPGVCRYCSTG